MNPAAAIPHDEGRPRAPHATAFAAVIVAGGAGTRLGGASKPELVIAGESLLDRTLEACAGASATVIVGGAHLARPEHLWAQEDPPGSGPAAGLAAGLAALASAGDASELVVVLGADAPRAALAVPRLLASASAAEAGDGAWIVDGEGFAQPLMAVYRRAAIAVPCAAHDLKGASLRRLTAALDMAAVADVDDAARDVDTWEDVQYWEGELS